MKNNIKDIILIVSIALALGVGRAIVDKDIDLIKAQPKIVEDLPVHFSEPTLINLTLSKKLFDDGAIFIDARDSIPFSEGHIKGSLNISWEKLTNEQIKQKLEDYSYDEIIVTYCSGGDCTLSLDLADYMFNEMSFEQVFVFEGGYPLWIERDLPINKFCKITSELEKNEECIYVE